MGGKEGVKKIKVYTCTCGEDVYEDDKECVNCGELTDPKLFVETEVAEIIYETPSED